ncbi:MAG: amidohydrolase [Pricia sp.]|nr:amidohydrolase [Pricia sp.]
MDQKGKIKSLAQSFVSEFIAVRRHLHKNPELSFKEQNTNAYLNEQLRKIGISDIVPVAETGLLATISGSHNGESVVLRADMDALPIEEKNDTSYISSKKGVMHACGHDAHMASLLMCAKILFALKDELRGNVKLLFQPGEELMPGGAIAVMKEKAYKSLRSVPHIGQHVRPDLPVGTIGFKSGKFMASMDELFLTIKGKGGHAAMPEKTVDAVLIASHIIVASQQLVSRMASPKIPTVLSFGKIVADGAVNILPDEVYIEGTLRTLDESWRKEAVKKLECLVTTLAESMGGTCKLEIKHGYPHLNNDSSLTNELKNYAIDYLGDDKIVDIDQWMAAEDFAYYSQKNPACFYMLGVGNTEKGISSGLHTPTFDLDESALEIGGGLMAWLAINSLSKRRS